MSVPLDVDGPTYCFGCGGGLGPRTEVRGYKLRGELRGFEIEAYICESCAAGRAERLVRVMGVDDYRSYHRRIG